MVQLRDKEQKMREFKKLIDKKKQEFGIHFWEKYGPRQSCLDQIDKIFCHHYFQRCYIDYVIDSTVQRVCREACEEFKSKYCNQELTRLIMFLPKSFRSEIIDCTDLPSLKESSICYHPDKTRGW